MHHSHACREFVRVPPPFRWARPPFTSFREHAVDLSVARQVFPTPAITYTGAENFLLPLPANQLTSHVGMKTTATRPETSTSPHRGRTGTYALRRLVEGGQPSPRSPVTVWGSKSNYATPNICRAFQISRGDPVPWWGRSPRPVPRCPGRRSAEISPSPLTAGSRQRPQ